jgi:hypothetical protein
MNLPIGIGAPSYRSPSSLSPTSPAPGYSRTYDPHAAAQPGVLSEQQTLNNLRRLQASNAVNAGAHLYGQQVSTPHYPTRPSGSGPRRPGMYSLPVGVGDPASDLLAGITPQIQNLVATEADKVGIAVKADTTKKIYMVGVAAAIAGGIIGIVGSRLLKR